MGEDKLFIFRHLDKAEQDKFINECKENNLFHYPLPFMARQEPYDEVVSYMNWVDLECVIENGYKPIFGECAR